MATKKASTEPKAAKAPRKRAAAATPAADDGSAAVTRVHDEGARLLASTDPADAQSISRDGPDDAQADAAAAEEVGGSLAAAVQRALRFADKDSALVKLLPASVIGTSARGTVIVLWNAPAIPPEGVVVDGRKLHRCLRAAGDGATISVSSTRLEIRFGTRRFTVAIVPGADLALLMPPTDGSVVYASFKPSVFHTAAAFSGDDKIEPSELAGVNISLGGCIACDRRGLIMAMNATDNSAIAVTLPRDAFDGLSVGADGTEAVFVGLTAQGHAVIADPRTSEWRVLVGWGPSFPGVRDVLSRWNAVLHVDVDKASFVSALKQFRIVQSAGSSVKFNVWTTPPGGEALAGDWLEMAGGDPGSTCEFTARLGVKIHRSAPVGVPGDDRSMFRVCVALDMLLKLATAFPGAYVRIGFGADAVSPIVVKNHIFEAGVMPMIDR